MEEFKNNLEDSPTNPNGLKNDFSHYLNNSNLNQGEILPSVASGKRNFSLPNKKFILIGAVVVFGFLVLGAGAYFGFDFYEKRMQVISVEKILPKDSNGVIRLAINPESNQFQLLESNMQKFPGYGILKKEIDESGEGKTITELFFEKLKEKNLDFKTDIKPAIGDQAYVVFPDMQPLFKNISRDMAGLGNNLYAQVKENNITENQDISRGMVMGIEDNYIDDDYIEDNYIEDEYISEPLIPLDFIMASDIKDEKKALEILEKLKSDSNYETEIRKFNGYEYIRIKIKNIENVEQGSYLNYIETFHMVLGGNWLMTSREDYLKEAIDRRKEQSLLNIFSEKKIGSLAEDESFKKVFSEITEDAQDGMMFMYVKLNFEKIFKNSCGNGGAICLDTEYFRYPEDIIYGFALRMEPDGIKISANSNKSSLSSGEIGNKGKSDSLANKLPAKAGDAWLDILIEHNNLKSFYYDFKKNNITEDGIQNINESRKEIKSETGIDFESDIIDLLSGSVGFSFFTSDHRMPDGVMLADLADSEKMLGTMKKIVDFSKNIQIDGLEYDLSLYSQYNTRTNLSQKNTSTQQTKDIQALISQIRASQLEEIKIPEGSIFVYKPIKSDLIPWSTYSPEIVFSVKDSFMILGSSYPAVEAVLKGMSDGKSEKLISGKYYNQASTKFYPENYFTTYINMFGVWNMVSYFERELEKNIEKSYDSICQNQNEMNSYYQSVGEENIYLDFCSPEGREREKSKSRDTFFAIGSILKTLNIISYSESLGDHSKKQKLFINLKELPQEEKKRAEKIMEELD